MKYVVAITMMLSLATVGVASSTPREGVESTIRAEDIADLLAWASNSKAQLEAGLKESAELPVSGRREALRTLIDSVVQASGTKTTELLMRVSLNRALTVDDILKETSQSSPEQDSLGRRVLKDGIIIALQVYIDDTQFLNQAHESGKNEIPLDLPIASFGIQSAQYYAGRAMTAPTHQATLAILKLDLGLFFNDLNKSQQRRQYAAILSHMAEFNKTIQNENPSSPEQFLKLSRKIKAFLDDQIEQAKRVPVPQSTNPIQTSSGYGGVNSIGMKFVVVRPGSFIMGSPSTELNRDNDEAPHRVELTQGFEIETTDVTQSQWVTLMGENPANFKNQSNCPSNYKVQPVAMCPNHPVESVSWIDAQEFTRRMNALNDGHFYRLPTEAEWEYSARAGTQTAYYFGESDSVIDQYAWYSGNSNSQTHDVASLQPNAWGLYDISGNVWQWVQDWYAPSSGQDVRNPQGANSGSGRVFRGGSWDDGARLLRSAYRSIGTPGIRYTGLGFRLVRTPK